MPIAALLVLLAGLPSLMDTARWLRADPAAFRIADADGDGRIDDREMEAARLLLARLNGTKDNGAPPRRLAVGGRDRNGDGALTPDELYP